MGGSGVGVRWGARRHRVCIRHPSILADALRPSARYNGEPWHRSCVTLAQIRRSCLYFCERQVAPSFPLSLPLSPSVPSQFRKRVRRDLRLHYRHRTFPYSRSYTYDRISGICSYELAIQLRAGSAVIHIYCIIGIQNRRLQNHGTRLTIALLRDCT